MEARSSLKIIWFQLMLWNRKWKLTEMWHLMNPHKIGNHQYTYMSIDEMISWEIFSSFVVHSALLHYEEMVRISRDF